MSRSAQGNFAGRLIDRLGDSSELIDAPTGHVVPAQEVPGAIASFAAGFRSAGLQAGDHVLIACGLSSISSLAYLGAMYGGLVAVPVNERALEASGESIFKKTAARALWTEQGIGCEWASRGGFKHIEGRLGAPRGNLVAPAPCGEDDLAALMPTSGSTGLPRLVRVSHGNLIANTEAIIRSQGLGAHERAMLILPVSYCFGASVLHTHLYQGGGVVFDSRFMFPDKVLHAIGRYGCTTFAGVPTAYNILLRRSNIRTIPLGTLRRFLQAGGALPTERIQEMRAIVPHAEFFAMYGQTEATSRISCLPPDRLNDKLGSVGVPLDNLQIRIVDTQGREAPVGEAGEIWVSGKSVCRGYLDEPQESAQKFRDGWLVTGDLAYCDQEGYLWIVGRKSEFIKMRGVRVSFAEIEARFASLPGVSECAATAVEHVEAGEALALYVVADAGAHDVVTSIRRKMPAEWICDSVNLVAELPKTPHGKLARSLLRETAHAVVDSQKPAPGSLTI